MKTTHNWTPVVAKAYGKKHAVGYYHKMRSLVFDLLGRECVKCGFEDIRALHFDHVFGGGTQERGRKGAAYMRRIIESVRNNEGRFQVLCANCNAIKKIENNENRKAVN